MPCDNRKCTMGLALASNCLDANKFIACEVQKCSKKFCNEKCLQIHFIEEHNFLDHNKKYFNYNDLNPMQKKLLKKTIEQSICGNFLEETLTTHKKRIASELSELINSKNLQIKFEQIENDYNNLEYFYYFHHKNFDNPHSPNANFSSTASSSLNKTGNFGNCNSKTNSNSNVNNLRNNNNENNNNFNSSSNFNYNNSNSYNNNNLIFPTNNNNNNTNSSISISSNNTSTKESKNFVPKQFTKIIGSGAFGDVFLVKNTLDGKLFAIKQLSREKVKENGIDSEIVYREINTHFKLIHNNIARLYDYYEDKKAFYLIMEYVDNGTLFNKIQKSNGLPEEKALEYFVQVSSAIFFLHENQLIHRDIKPENCLIDKNDNVKLCDFGWTVEISKGERITFCGTYEYMAPEIIKEIPYNHMIDVWSLGVLLYELNHSFSPFRAKQNKNNPLKYDPNNQIMNNIIKNKFEFEKDMSNECKDLIARILNPDCDSRLTLKDIFTHPYLMNYFISNMNLKVTKMFDVLESALVTKKFIFIKFFTSSTKKKSTAKAENSTIFEDMEISINKSLRTKNSKNDLNTFTTSCNSKGEFASAASAEKNIEHKILNLRKNIFFFKVKSEFLSKLKRATKPQKDKAILLNNLNSIIKENNSLLIKTKNKSFTNDIRYDDDDHANNEICNFETIESKILLKRKNTTNDNLDPNASHNNISYNSIGSGGKAKIPPMGKKASLNPNSDPQSLNPLKSILVNKNSEFLEEVLDKIQNKRSAKHDSLDLDNCDIVIKKDLLNNSKNNNLNNNANSLKKKKSSKRNIKNLMAETQLILNGALASSTNPNSNSKNFGDLNTSNNNLLLNELSKSSEKMGRRVLFPNNSINRSYNEQQQQTNNNLLVSNNSSIRIICEKANNYENNVNYQNRCSSIKELNNISNSSYSLMKEIKDINTAIEHNSKKIENFIDTKNNIKKILEDNLINPNSNSNSKNNFTNKDNLNPNLNSETNSKNNNIYIYNANGNTPNNNITNNINNQETADINSNFLHYRKASEIKEFNINDINLNLSKMSDLRICKNIHLSLLENSLLSAIKKDSPDFTYNFSNKNILNHLNNNLNNNNNPNNNEIIIISSSRNNDGKNFDNPNHNLINQSFNNFAISDKSLLKMSQRENNESQNFWFAINNTSLDQPETSRNNNNKEKGKLITLQESFVEQVSVLSGKSNKNNNEGNRGKNLNKSNTSLGNNINNNNNSNIRLNNSKVNESLLAPEKVKEFSLLSNKDSKSKQTKHKSHKSINNSKISFDSGCEESKNFGNSLKKNSKNSKNNNNNSLVSNEKNYVNQKSLKKNPYKISKQFTNSSNGNSSWELKNNIMKIRKNNRKSINKKHKESSRLIKIKDFEEILVDNNNKSFEEKTENCSMWKNFFGFFSVFKCGGGANPS